MLFSLIDILQLVTHEQLLTLSEHPCSLPVFSEVRVAHSILSFLCSVLYITACPIALFLLAIVLSLLLRYTDSDYPCVIFKLDLPLS